MIRYSEGGVSATGDSYAEAVQKVRAILVADNEDKPICSLCGQPGEIKYTSDDIGRVCVHCEATDKDAYAAMRSAKRASKDRNRNAMHNIADKMGVADRVTFPNEGTCLLDGKFYYYAQKKKARVKGKQKYYKMRGFQHFIDRFGKPK